MFAIRVTMPNENVYWLGAATEGLRRLGERAEAQAFATRVAAQDALTRVETRWAAQGNTYAVVEQPP